MVVVVRRRIEFNIAVVNRMNAPQPWHYVPNAMYREDEKVKSEECHDEGDGGRQLELMKESGICYPADSGRMRILP